MKLAYSALLLCAIAMLLTACGSDSPWKESKNAGGEYEITAKPSPEDMTKPAGTTLADATDGVLIRTTAKNPRPGGQTGGAALAIQKPYKEHFNNKEVTVTVVAKKASTKPADMFWVSYSTNDMGNSGWHAFKPTNQFAPYQFTYMVKATQSPDYVGVCDYTGEGRGIVIQEIKVSAKK